MADADLDHLAGLLADPVVMRFYPAPRTRAEAAAWIAGNRRRTGTGCGSSRPTTTPGPASSGTAA
nr:GNAT family N-acetyltransferase [Micrococcus aloeverae]